MAKSEGDFVSIIHRLYINLDKASPMASIDPKWSLNGRHTERRHVPNRTGPAAYWLRPMSITTVRLFLFLLLPIQCFWKKEEADCCDWHWSQPIGRWTSLEYGDAPLRLQELVPELAAWVRYISYIQYARWGKHLAREKQVARRSLNNIVFCCFLSQPIPVHKHIHPHTTQCPWNGNTVVVTTWLHNTVLLLKSVRPVA